MCQTSYYITEAIIVRISHSVFQLQFSVTFRREKGKDHFLKGAFDSGCDFI